MLNPDVKNIKLEKIESLFVRACKGSNSIKRMLRIRKHFYFPDKDVNAELIHLQHILFRIINKTKPLSGEALAIQLAPRRDGYYEESVRTNYNYRLVEVLVYHIRFLETKDLHGFTPPTRFTRNTTPETGATKPPARPFIHKSNVTHIRDALNLQSTIPQGRYQVGVQTTTKIEKPSWLRKFLNYFYSTN